MQKSRSKLKSFNWCDSLCVLVSKHWHLIIFLALLFVQVNVYETDSRSINAYHLVLVFFVIVYILDFLLRPLASSFLTICCAVLFVVSLTPIFLFKWGLSFDGLMLPMAFCYFLVGIHLAKFSIAQRQEIFNFVLFFYILAVLIRALWNFDNLHLIYSHSNSNSDWYFSSGGKNIEASMFAILCLLYRGRYGLVLGVLLTLTSVMFESRIGMIGCIFYWFKLYIVKKGKSSYLSLVLSLLCSVLLLVLSLHTNLIEEVIKLNVDREIRYFHEGVGRLSLWENTIRGIIAEPFGVGPGAAVDYINKNYSMSYWENNVHNIYLSWVLELGWIHGTVLSFTFLYLFCSPRLLYDKVISINEYILGLYIVISGFIQYTGYDAILFIFLGLNLYKYFITRNMAIPHCIPKFQHGHD